MERTLRLRPSSRKPVRWSLCAYLPALGASGATYDGKSRRLLSVNPATLSLRDRWLFALKPASWPKMLVAAVLGQAIGVAATGHIHWGGLLLGLAFTVFDLVFVVLIND